MKRNLIVHHGLNFERTIPVYLSVNPTIINNVDYDGETRSVAVDVGSESQTWDYSDDAAWIIVKNATKVGDDADVSIQCLANDTGLLRQGHVTFISDNCPDVVVTVNQLANPV